MKEQHASVPLRRSRSFECLVRSFSTNSRPALRAAFGRPPARRRHDGHRGTGLTLQPRGSQSRHERPVGAHLGHAPTDSSGQPRSTTDPSACRFTCADAVDQHPARNHTVYGMQGVRGSNPLSSTRHNASTALPLRVVCQQIVSRSRHVAVMSLWTLGGIGHFEDIRNQVMGFSGPGGRGKAAYD